MSKLDKLLLDFLDSPFHVVLLGLVLLLLFLLVLFRQEVKFIVKSLSRNLLRTILTALATMVLVFVVTLVWSVLWLLDTVTTEKTKNLKAIVTERWQIPSQMPFSYARDLAEGAASQPGDVVPSDSMTWGFYGGTIDPDRRTRENMIFFFCMEPRKLLTMMDDLDQLSPEETAALQEGVRQMEEDPRRVVIGRERLQAMNKKVGERISVVSMNYKDIDIDGLEIIGTFPDGRYNQSAVMNVRMLHNSLDAYKVKKKLDHPMANKTLNLVWLRVPDTRAYQRVAEQILASPKFSDPAVKCETASSGVAAFLDAYRDLLWGVRWLLVPAILVTMALVIANAISISVRERRTEMAVLKVLGFSPNHIMLLVLGEALLIGCLSGLVSAAATFLYVNYALGGIKFPIAFFPAFYIPPAALWWGPVLGCLTAYCGSIAPAWSARSVKVSEVFSKVA
jgi:putative ABC transport system permease protein